MSLNNRPLCNAGADDLCVLTAILTAGGKLGERSRGRRRQRRRDIDLRVAGMTSRAHESDNEYLDWAKKKLAVGDQVTIEIVDASAADRPKSARSALTAQGTGKMQFEWAKRYYLANRRKYEARQKARSSE